jgi:magnesium chelatase subunit D
MIEQSKGKSSFYGRGSAPSFAGIVGQADLKESLLAIAANDALDGLLIRGEKGTAKSTAVRALADLLPTQRVIEGCPYGCPPNASDRQCPACREQRDPSIVERRVPLVTVPLGATRERVVGTLSVADALAGEYEFDPGLLARANRGVLYVDEVNLLDDHLVDVLLDAAASGVNRVERDGVSLAHPAEFTLIGTMNPEEGDLRPQLRDRFALQTTVSGCDDLDDRVRIVEQALEVGGSGSPNDREPSDHVDPGTRLRRARGRLDEVALPTAMLERIADLCLDAGIEGHRGDIATARTSRTLAALAGRTKVIESDVRRAAAFALPHRLQSRPFEDAPDPDDLLDEHFDDPETETEPDQDGGSDGDDDRAEADRPDRTTGEDGGDTDGGDDPSDGDGSDPSDSSDRPEPGEANTDGPSGRDSPAGDRDSAPDASGRTGNAAEDADPDDGGDRGQQDDADPVPSAPGHSPAPDLAVTPLGDGASGPTDRGSGSRIRPEGDGPRVRTERATATDSIDAPASIRAASTRGSGTVESRDLRRSVRRSEASALVVFVVDASASMRPAMRAAKGVVLDLLKNAYQHRDEVAFVSFAGDDADVLLPPTDSVPLAARHLKDLPTGDRTPLPAGLRCAGTVLERAEPSASIAVIVTDGRANVADGSPVARTRTAATRLGDLADHTVVVDAGENDRTGLVDLLAEETGGERVSIAALSAERVDATVGAVKNN